MHVLRSLLTYETIFTLFLDNYDLPTMHQLFLLLYFKCRTPHKPQYGCFFLICLDQSHTTASPACTSFICRSACMAHELGALCRPHKSTVDKVVGQYTRREGHCRPWMYTSTEGAEKE